MPTEHSVVMLTLCVTTPWGPITAHAKMDFMEMESTALVTTRYMYNMIVNIYYYIFSYVLHVALSTNVSTRVFKHSENNPPNY